MGVFKWILCMFVSFSSLSSLICLSLACPTHRMNLALPGRNLVHIPALAWFAGTIQTAGNFPSATGAGPGSQIFPLRGTFFFFVLQITDWSLKPNKMKCCVFAKLTRRWLPWDCVGSAVKGKGSGQPASSRAQGFSLSSGDSTIEWRAQGFEGSWGCF